MDGGAWWATVPGVVKSQTRLSYKMVLVVKNRPANAGDIRDLVQSLGQEDPLREGMATHSNILAWSIPMDREV